jgi:heat shock protein HtpX
MNAFFILPTNVGERIAGLFATHPPVEKRLERLAGIAREMGRLAA